MLFTLATNPTAPLMLVALVLAGLMLVGVVIYINVFNHRYPTSEDRRKVRRAEIGGGKLIAGASLVLITLGLAIVSSVGDMITYSQNVQQVRQVTANAGISTSEAQAKQLLGNDHDEIYKPIIADADGNVGVVRVKGEQLRLSQLDGSQYILLTDKLEK